MKKVITVLIISVLLISALAVTSFAAETEAPEIVDAAEDANIFDTVYGIIIENSDKILSALAFAGSLFLILIYKKGMLPILKSALEGLGSSVSRLGDEARRGSEQAGEGLALAAEKLTAAESIISELTERLGALEKKLAEADALRENSEKLEVIMDYQIEMLYNVFMSSSLPLYQKEAIGEKISAMRSKLSRSPEASEVNKDESSDS